MDIHALSRYITLYPANRHARLYSEGFVMSHMYIYITTYKAGHAIRECNPLKTLPIVKQLKPGYVYINIIIAS